MSDLLKKFQSKVRASSSTSNARYFLMTVEKVRVGEDNKNKFRVFGRRLDNDQLVAVDTKKAASGQYVPEVGGVMRADKVQRVSTNHPQIAHYTAEYFHAYAEKSFCLSGVVRANESFYRDDKHLAVCDIIDPEAVSKLIVTADDFDKMILEGLKPWLRQDGVLARDVTGKSFWGKNGALGIQPVVHLRFAGATEIAERGTFYGIGAIDQNQGQGGQPNPRLPTDEEIIAHFRKNPNYEVLRACTLDPDFAQVGFVAIPGLRINVGREALGARENYLGSPKSWEWVRDDMPMVDGAHPKKRGWRGGILHMKLTEKNRFIIVDAAPSMAAPLTLDPPLSQFEYSLTAPQSVKEPAEQAVPGKAAQAAAAAPMVQEEESARREAHKPNARADMNAPAPDSSPASVARQPANYESNEFDYSPEDLAAMEGMNSVEHDGFDDIDSLLEEATNLQQARRNPNLRM